jgi:hypothetical protein
MKDNYSFDEVVRYSLNYYTRSGKFNLMSDEESFSCHLQVNDQDNNRVISCNTSPKYELDGTDVDEAIEEVQRDIDSHWISTATDDKKLFIAFLKRNKGAIRYGTDIKELEKLTKQIASMSERTATLSERIVKYEARTIKRKLHQFQKELRATK